MTENNKRFVAIDDDIIKDTEYGGLFTNVYVADWLNVLITENEQLKQYNQQITKVLEDGGVILTKNQLKSLVEMKNEDSVEVRHLKTANAKLKDEIRALREYIQKKELKE